jgi:hypothetical protein
VGRYDSHPNVVNTDANLGSGPADSALLAPNRRVEGLGQRDRRGCDWAGVMYVDQRIFAQLDARLGTKATHVGRDLCLPSRGLRSTAIRSRKPWTRYSRTFAL